MSERRACRVIGADRKGVRYRSTREDDADLRGKLRELANQRRRFGYAFSGLFFEEPCPRACQASQFMTIGADIRTRPRI